MSQQKSILILILLLVLIRGVIYASVVPPWQAPDEPAQFERVRASLTLDDWNSTSENAPIWYDELIQSLFTFNFWDYIDAPRLAYDPNLSSGHYLSLYNEIYDGLYGSRFPYALIGWPLFVTPKADIVLQLYLVRLNTVLMNVGIIFFAYLIVGLIFPKDDFLKLGVPLIILLNPQHTHLLSTVNNGNLAELLTTIALYFAVKGIINRFSWHNILATLIFVIVAMWTKATAYFLPFTIGTISLFYLWQYRRFWPWLFPVAVILGGVTYYFLPERLGILLGWAIPGLLSGNLYLDPIVPQDLFQSFWAMPGWTMIRLHPFWYQVLGVACIMAVLGLIFVTVTKLHLIASAHYQPRIQALIVLAVSVLIATGVLLGWSAISQTIVYRQGRSIYPVVVPIALLLMLGWRQLIPSEWHKSALFALVVGFIFFDTIVLFNYIVPFFYSRF